MTNKKEYLYICDRLKNIECEKTSCGPGYCLHTTNRLYSKNHSDTSISLSDEYIEEHFEKLNFVIESVDTNHRTEHTTYIEKVEVEDCKPNKPNKPNKLAYHFGRILAFIVWWFFIFGLVNIVGYVLGLRDSIINYLSIGIWTVTTLYIVCNDG